MHTKDVLFRQKRLIFHHKRSLTNIKNNFGFYILYIIRLLFSHQLLFSSYRPPLINWRNDSWRKNIIEIVKYNIIKSFATIRLNLNNWVCSFATPPICWQASKDVFLGTKSQSVGNILKITASNKYTAIIIKIDFFFNFSPYLPALRFLLVSIET